MSILAAIVPEAGVVTEVDKDFLGGGYEPFDSGIYSFIIKLAYLTVSKGGANCLNLELQNKIDDRILKQQVYFTNKTGSSTFTRDGKVSKLPGYKILEALAVFVAEKKVADLAEETKTVEIYDYDAQGNVNTDVPMLTDLLGKPTTMAIFRKLENKNKLIAGKYEATAETRESNDIQCVFRTSDGLTAVEVKAGATEAKFLHDWEKKWAGVTKDVRKVKEGAPASGGVAPGSTATNAAADLF